MKTKLRARQAIDAAGRVDIQRLVRVYGPEVASEVLRKLVTACARDQERGASRRTR
jgi:hypothetical protein